MVSGACHSTADTLRPCLQILKTKPGTKLVSAFFLIVVPDCEYGANGAFVFADSGLNQNPNPVQLADIAASSAESFEYLVGEKVYFDTAVVLGVIPEEQFVRMVRNHGVEKILFGTDSPWAGQKEFVDYMKQCPLTEEEKERIFSQNALELLGISK